MTVSADADRQELELRVSDVAHVVRQFKWTDLAERVPTGYTYTRPKAEGTYMAVTWDAEWQKWPGGAILIIVQGYFDKDHQTPICSKSEVIRRRTLLDRLLRRSAA